MTAEPGQATYARWLASMEGQGVGCGAWDDLSPEDRHAWADVEDWHPAVNEQVAVLDQASTAMDVLTEERDEAQRQLAEVMECGHNVRDLQRIDELTRELDGARSDAGRLRVLVADIDAALGPKPAGISDPQRAKWRQRAELRS